MVATLAGFAPVVVLSNQDPPASLSALVAAGAADFVPFATGDELRFSRCYSLFRSLFPEASAFYATAHSGILCPERR